MDFGVLTTRIKIQKTGFGKSIKYRAEVPYFTELDSSLKTAVSYGATKTEVSVSVVDAAYFAILKEKAVKNA